MPKPITASLKTLPEVYSSVANDLMQRLGDAQAAQAGPPITDPIEPAGDTQRVKAWNARPPEATDQAMQQMAQQRYQEHRQAGLSEQQAIAATAEDLTHFRYGQRMKLYTYGQPTAVDQVKEAKRIAALAARDSTPDPPPPPPSMPSGHLTNLATTEGLPAPPAPPPAPGSIAALLAGAGSAPPAAPMAPPSAASPPEAGPPTAPGRY